MGDVNERANRKRLRSVFAMARKLPTVAAAIDVDHVLDLRPAWTEEQAAEFLKKHGDLIGEAMALRGTQVLAQMLPENGGGYAQ